MNDRERDRLLKTSGKRRLTSEEQTKLDAWYASFDASERDLTVFHSREHEEKVRVRLLDKILSKIPERPSSRSKGFRKKSFPWMKIAALFAFALLAFPLYKYLKPTNGLETAGSSVSSIAKADVGQILKIRLADGSEISLNSGSMIQYPKHFTGATREICLEGEAFFEIAHNPERPFIVRTGKITTQVLGTSFNVRAYPGMDQVKVAVATGKVRMGSAGEYLGVLDANEEISYYTVTDHYEISNVENMHRADSWRIGEVRLDGVSFKELSLTIKNTWGYLLETKSPQLQAASYKTTFHRNHTIEDVMRVISKITNATYQIRDNIITLDE